MEQWAEYFPDFAVMIEGKLADEAYSRLLFDNNRIIGFVDWKIVETCQPGSGPAEDRHGHNVMSVYSGYTKHHGLKILTVTLPNGLIGALYDAISTRKNDNSALNLSNLNVDMMRLQPDVIQARRNGEDMLYYSIYDDAIFPLLNCITGCNRQPFQGEQTEREEAENASMCWVHISAERPNETLGNKNPHFEKQNGEKL
jgi:hypothetical protein